MPILSIQTNVKQDKISADFVSELSSRVAQLLHKPESYLAVHIQGDQILSFGGSNAPCAVGCLKSIGGVGGGKKNSEHAKAIFDIVNRFLGIQGDRMYIEFVDVSASEIAYNSKTFA